MPCQESAAIQISIDPFPVRAGNFLDGLYSTQTASQRCICLDPGFNPPEIVQGWLPRGIDKLNHLFDLGVYFDLPRPFVGRKIFIFWRTHLMCRHERSQLYKWIV